MSGTAPSMTSPPCRRSNAGMSIFLSSKWLPGSTQTLSNPSLLSRADAQELWQGN